MPAGITEPAEGALDEAGVVVIQEPVEVLALPQDSHVDPRAERCRDPLQETDRQLLGSTAFDPGDGLR